VLTHADGFNLPEKTKTQTKTKLSYEVDQRAGAGHSCPVKSENVVRLVRVPRDEIRGSTFEDNEATIRRQ